MVQAKDSVKMGNTFKAVLSIMLVLSVIFSGVAMYNSNKEITVEGGLSAADVEAIVAAELSNQNVSVPSAEEIAALVESPKADKLSEVYEKVYADEFDNLTDNATTAYNEEFSLSDEDFNDTLEALEDELKVLIDNFDVLNSIEIDSDENETEVINLGLEDAEDKEAKVIRVYEIKYELDYSTEQLKAEVEVVGIVTYDEDEDEFEAELSYALI